MAKTRNQKDVRVMDPNTLLCAVHGTPISAKESEPCKHCVEDFGKMKDVNAALKAVELYQRARGVEEEIIEHSPLHYNMADLVTGLMKLASQKGLDWKVVVRDAKEGAKE